MTRLEKTMALVYAALDNPPADLLAMFSCEALRETPSDWNALDWLGSTKQITPDEEHEAWAHLEDLHEVPDAERLQVVHDWRERQGAPR